MAIFIRTSILLIFVFNTNAYSRATLAKGLKCQTTTTWTKEEEYIFKKIINIDSTEYYFLTSEKIDSYNLKYPLKTQRCTYTSKNLSIGVKETSATGLIHISLRNRNYNGQSLFTKYYFLHLKNNNKIISLFEFKTTPQLSMRPLFYNVALLRPNNIYIGVIVLQLKDGRSEVYAMKINPK